MERKIFSSIKKIVSCDSSRHQVEYGIGCGFNLIPKNSKCIKLYGSSMGIVFDCMSASKAHYIRRNISLFDRNFFNALANTVVGDSEEDILDSLGFITYLLPGVFKYYSDSNKYDVFTYMKNLDTIIDKFIYIAERLPVIGAWNILCSFCDEYFSPFFPHIVYECDGDVPLFWNDDVFGAYWANKDTILKSISNLTSKLNSSKFSNVIVNYDNFHSITIEKNIFHVLANVLFSSSTLILLNRSVGLTSSSFGLTILYLLGYHDVLKYIFKHYKSISSMPYKADFPCKQDYALSMADFIFGCPRPELIPYLFKFVVSFIKRCRSCMACLYDFVDIVISRALSIGGNYANVLLNDILTSFVPGRSLNYLTYDSYIIQRHGKYYIDEPNAYDLLRYITGFIDSSLCTKGCYYHMLNDDKSSITYRPLTMCENYRGVLNVLSALSWNDISSLYGVDISFFKENMYYYWSNFSRYTKNSDDFSNLVEKDPIMACWNMLFSPFQYYFNGDSETTDFGIVLSNIDHKTPELAVKMLCDVGMYRYASILRYCARKMGIYDTSNMDKYLMQSNDSVLYGCLLNYIFEVMRRCYLHEFISSKNVPFYGYFRTIGGFSSNCPQVIGL